MKKTFLNSLSRNRLLFIVGIVLVSWMYSCIDDEVKEWKPVDVELQISEYMELNAINYSEFYELVKRTNFAHLLRARGPYTLFLPTNEAMENYYTLKGISSLEELSLEDMDKIVRTHLFAFLIPTSSIGLGSIRDTNALGDFIATEFNGSDIVISKFSKIIKRDVENANGLIHILDRTMDPVVNNVYENIVQNSGYSIFNEGLRRTGLDDVLNLVTTDYGKSVVRVWYTVLAVPDYVFNSNNISSIDELILKYDDGLGALTDATNGFYKYMEYHCLEGVYYLSKFEPGVYPIISRENQINIKVDTSYKINYHYDTTDSMYTYTSFIYADANISAKNGVVHGIDNLMEPMEPIPAPIVFQLTDYPDLKAEDCYLSYIKNFMDGENTFAKIKWQGDYLQYYWKGDQGYMDHDCISMSQGFWWLEFTVPKVPKGKYSITAYFKTGENRADMICYIDGVKMDELVATRADSKSYAWIPIGEVDWPETSEHTFKFVTLVPGILYIDRFLYTPM